MLDRVDSTMAEALRRAPGLASPCWIMAHEQTAGRGRRGRAWTGGQGNFAATLVMRPKGPPAQAALRSFVAALALHEALAGLLGSDRTLSLKWPNDVLLNGGKVAGILLESIGAGQGVAHLAVGIGVNLHTAPPADAVEPRALRPVALATETGLQIGAETFLSHLAVAFDRQERHFATYGFGPLRAAWLDRAARLGEVITARTAREEITGTFETVDEDGNLVLRSARGREAIPAADVFF
ncbi:MAG: biotin--[acetyl-CoA-carboxylase] ligase [Paracoccaceae bacterium]